MMIKVFNQRALRLTQPGSRWVLSAIRIGFLMVIIGFVLTSASFVGRAAIFAAISKSLFGENLADAILTVMLSPALETLLLVLVHQFVRPCLGLTGFVFVTAALAAAAHFPLKQLPPVDAAVGFVIMSYQYASFRERLGSSRAFWGVALSHATNNGIVFFLLLVINSST